MKSATTKRKSGTKAVPTTIIDSNPLPGADERLGHIATAAYYKAEARSFVPGQELDDWLEAEAEFDKWEEE